MFIAFYTKVWQSYKRRFPGAQLPTESDRIYMQKNARKKILTRGVTIKQRYKLHILSHVSNAASPAAVFAQVFVRCVYKARAGVSFSLPLAPCAFIGRPRGIRLRICE